MALLISCPCEPPSRNEQKSPAQQWHAVNPHMAPEECLCLVVALLAARRLPFADDNRSPAQPGDLRQAYRREIAQRDLLFAGRPARALLRAADGA